MIRPDQKPDEVVAACAVRLPGLVAFPDIVRDALAAALNAWPWAETRVEDWHTPPETVLILSLPKEGADE